MAEYVFPNLPTEPLKVGDKIRFNYTGTSQQINRPEVSRYYIEVYGASGGGRVETNNPAYGLGGKGAKAEGELITNSDPLIIVVGGVGKLGNGGFNGGGTGGLYGGGATDVRRGGSQLENRIIVAAGGGGAAYNGNGTINGGYGGSASGGSGSNSASSTGGGGGTQTSGGTGGSGVAPGKNGNLGIGGQGTNSAGGGGGGYYGGGGGGSNQNISDYAGGGGGSSYIGGVLKGKMTAAENTGNGYAILTVMTPPNYPPTINLTSPTNNLTLTEGKTYSIGGTATDPDNDDVVTIKYRINNGTARAINSGVSDGSTPIPFTKTLTYRNKRLWDGSTDVVGYDLAEGTNHTLYVWAEDDKGGKSPDTTRTFTVTWNRPPVISGQDIDLGTINTPPSESFSVTDPEGNPFTIEYYLDNVLFDSFAGVDGQTYTVSLTPDQWIRTSLAQHQLKVRAVDNQGAYSDRIFTFTRTDDRIEFTLNYSNDNVKNFFTTNQKANRILVTMDAVIPTGAVLLVEACNNAYDDQPTWEDITSQVLAKRGYIFTNSTSASGKWGINVRFKITKGTATETVLFNGFGGAFD